MKTMTQSLSYTQNEAILTVSPFGRFKELLQNKIILFNLLILVFIFISALAIIVVQAQNRLLFSELSSMQMTRDQLHTQWGQLLLEESTWSTQARVAQIAEDKLAMARPDPKQVIMVQE